MALEFRPSVFILLEIWYNDGSYREYIKLYGRKGSAMVWVTTLLLKRANPDISPDSLIKINQKRTQKRAFSSKWNVVFGLVLWGIW